MVFRSFSRICQSPDLLSDNTSVGIWAPLVIIWPTRWSMWAGEILTSADMTWGTSGDSDETEAVGTRNSTWAFLCGSIDFAGSCLAPGSFFRPFVGFAAGIAEVEWWSHSESIPLALNYSKVSAWKRRITVSFSGFKPPIKPISCLLPCSFETTSGPDMKLKSGTFLFPFRSRFTSPSSTRVFLAWWQDVRLW